MGILVTLFLFNQAYTDYTWYKYGGTLENTHFQHIRGAMSTTPVVKWSYVTGSPVEANGAVIGDVNGDAKNEVVIGSTVDHKIYCLDGATGAVDWSYAGGGEIWGSCAIANIDGIGNMEIVFGSYDDKKVCCLDGTTGALNWSYTTGGFVYSSPAVTDIDGDVDMEIIIGSEDYKVYCLDKNGGVKWSYPTGFQIILSSPAVADVDDDGEKEVVIGSADNKVYCLDKNGVLEWSYTAGSYVQTVPALADIDGNGKKEVIFGSDDYKIYSLDGPTGAIKWSYATGGYIHASPAIIGGEVIIGSGDNKVYCLDGVTGGANWSYAVPGTPRRGILLADVDGDNDAEVLVPNNTGSVLTCLNSGNGSFQWEKTLAFDVHDIIAGDIDNDGCIELITGTNNSPSAIWALEDAGNSNSCGPLNVEESKELKVESLEFKIIGAKIYLSCPNTIEANIKLYDICGRLKQVIYSGSLSKGSYTFTPDIKVRDIYFATFTGSNYKVTKKLVLLK